VKLPIYSSGSLTRASIVFNTSEVPCMHAYVMFLQTHRFYLIHITVLQEVFLCRLLKHHQLTLHASPS
jgi:hypothetical protein